MRKMQKTNLHKLGRHLSNAKIEIIRVALKHARTHSIHHHKNQTTRVNHMVPPSFHLDFLPSY